MKKEIKRKRAEHEKCRHHKKKRTKKNELKKMVLFERQYPQKLIAKSSIFYS